MASKRKKKLNPILSVTEAAKFLKLSKPYLYQLRFYGKGPAFTKDGHKIKYDRADLEAWNSERLNKKAQRKRRSKPANANPKPQGRRKAPARPETKAA